MRERAIAASCVIAMAMLVAVPTADALQPGVHVNPRSPSGTEYSFPLGSTRQQLDGGSSAGVSAGSGPLFGVGLGGGPAAVAGRHGADAVGGDRRGLNRKRRGRNGERSRRGSGATRPAGGSLRREQDEAIAALSQNGSSTGALELVVAVVLVGAAGGLGLWLIAGRRRSDAR